MRNYIKCLLSLVFCVFYPVSGMIVPIQKIKQQFLPKDCLKQVQWKCDLQSLGRLAATCSYMNDNWQVEDFSEKQFNLVEKCLYFYAPKISSPIHVSDAQYGEGQQIKKRLCSIINAHIQKIDMNIREVHAQIIQSEWGSSFYDVLGLTDDNRIAFYYGKLPGQKPRFMNLSEYDSESEDVQQEYGDLLLDDILDAAYEDAKFALIDGNAERAGVVLNRYEQFVNYDNGLIEPLCFLGNGPLLLQYLSIPERSVEYAMAPNGYTAIEIARDICEDDQLVEFLKEAIEKERVMRSKLDGGYFGEEIHNGLSEDDGIYYD